MEAVSTGHPAYTEHSHDSKMHTCTRVNSGANTRRSEGGLLTAVHMETNAINDKE